jgi:hypothetical protein
MLPSVAPLESVAGAEAAETVVKEAQAIGAGETTDNVFEALTRFIPTEMLAPFVAGMSLLAVQLSDKKLTEAQHVEQAMSLYGWFTVATPLVFVFFYYVKIAMEKKPWPNLNTDGPFLFWRAFLALMAFAVWGTSVPTNPAQVSVGGPAVAGFLAIIISPILFGLDTIFMRAMGRD